MLLLERLRPDERAAFVLHEAFDCDYAEIGRILERTPATCRQIVSRARTRLQRAGAPLGRPDPVAHARIVECLRAALEAQDRTGLLRLFSDTPEVVSDAPVGATLDGAMAAPLSTVASVTAGAAVGTSAVAQHAHQPAAAPWVDTVTSLAQQASNTEVVSVEGRMAIALFFEGDVVGVLDVSTNGVLDGSTKIVSLRIVTNAAQLHAANRALGRAAVKQMLSRIQRRPPAASVAMSRDFPVDVYA
jgi:RNA polymerase sigma-70 factor (ECF subfamily)